MANPSIDDYANSILEMFTKEITDYVFLMIENDRDLMLEYLRLVSDTKLDTVNQTIGKRVKSHFNLEDGARNNTPKSKLIKSFQEFKK